LWYREKYLNIKEKSLYSFNKYRHYKYKKYIK
jgi:hypothetical protein